MTSPTTVVVVDDQELVRTGLRRILSDRNGFRVVGECADGDEAQAAVARLHPDAVVMDIRMRRVDGVEATRRISSRAGAPPVLVLTTFDDDELLSGALRAGASGFILKDAPAEDLIRAVRAVVDGDGWLDPSVTGRVLDTYRVSPAPAPSQALRDLTPRELDVLRLLGRGRSNAEIARELVVSEVTVKTHVRHLFTKLHLRDRAAAIVFAFDHGIVRPSS